MPASPFIKSPLNYIGGKYRILPDILPLFPAHPHRFADLFAGGFNVGINAQADRIYCNDQIGFLIEMFQFFRETPADLLTTRIRKRIVQFRLSAQNTDGYNALRAAYNRCPNPLDLFVLACYSFNHQIRFNSRHQFNTPFGRNRSVYNASIERNLCRFCAALQSKDIVFSSLDFSEFDFSEFGTGDFVYCDPPYLISIGSYNDGSRGFKDWTSREELQLLDLLDTLNRRGIAFALSNVLRHKGETNSMLLEWSERYWVSGIGRSYANCSYHFKNRTAETVEVLITNYPPSRPDSAEREGFQTA